jgi:malonate transporter and related proteins
MAPPPCAQRIDLARGRARIRVRPRARPSETSGVATGAGGAAPPRRDGNPGAALDAILDVALPFFGIIFAGYAAGRFGLMSRDGIRGLNDFVFHFALPALLFLNVALAPFEQLVAPRLLGAYYLATLSVALLGALLARALGGPAHRGIVGLRAIAGVFGNIGYMGIPLVLTAFGREAGIVAVLILTADNVVQLTFAIVLLEAATGGGSLGRTLATVAAGLARNPMILAIVAGVLCAAAGVVLPAPVAGFAELLGAAAAPCALFALGATLVAVPLAAVDAEVLALTALKIVVHPATVLLATTVLVPLPAETAWLVFVIAAMPTGANVFVLAQRYGTWIAPASTVVLLTHIGSVATVSAVLAVPV